MNLTPLKAVVWGFIALISMLWLGSHILQGASAVPVGDESAHLLRLFDLKASILRANGLIEKLAQVLIASDAYPNTLYAFTILSSSGDLSIDHARFSILILTALHAALGVTLGARLWGQPAALAYTVMVCCSPILLAYQQTYLIDVALVSGVGCAVLLAEAGDGFRNRWTSLFFVLVATITVLTKWTALIWLAPSTMWLCWKAIVHDTPELGLVLRRATAMFTLAIVGCGLIGWFSTFEWVEVWQPKSADAWAPLFVMFIGAVVMSAIVSSRPSPTLRAAFAMVAILLLAGPWFTFRMPFLLDRMAHEMGLDPTLTGSPREVLFRTTNLLLILIPGGIVWLLSGVMGSILFRRRRMTVMTRILAAFLGGFATVQFLPFNARYLLPIAPLMAGASVACWAVLSKGKQWALAMTIIVLTIWTGQGYPPAQQRPHTWTTDQYSLGILDFPTGVGSPPKVLSHRDVDDLFVTLQALCPQQPCIANLTQSHPGVQDRALAALGKARGFDLQFTDLCEGPEVPLSGLRQTLTVCVTTPR